MANKVLPLNKKMLKPKGSNTKIHIITENFATQGCLKGKMTCEMMRRNVSLISLDFETCSLLS